MTIEELQEEWQELINNEDQTDYEIVNALIAEFAKNFVPLAFEVMRTAKYVIRNNSPVIYFDEALEELEK